MPRRRPSQTSQPGPDDSTAPVTTITSTVWLEVAYTPNRAGDDDNHWIELVRHRKIELPKHRSADRTRHVTHALTAIEGPVTIHHIQPTTAPPPRPR